MPTRVLKFGGTSVETPTHILSVARRILACHQAGDAIVVVVSAMGQTTDELIRLAQRVSRTPPRRELDMLLTAGERISMTLLAMCLESLGCPAISFTGSQSGIVTDARHSEARIRAVRAVRIQEELARGRVVIVAGFQGVSQAKEVTTLGRGGSDTTAVALAIHLGAERCEIYTDVAGVFSADPRVVPGAHRLPRVGYDTMIVLSHLGGRVLFRRAVLLARKFGLPVEVRSSRSQEPGTLIPGDIPGNGSTGRQQAISGNSPESVSGNNPDSGPAGPRPSLPRAAGRTYASSTEKPALILGAGTTGTQEEEPMETERILAVALESPVYWARITLPAPATTSATPEASGASSGPRSMSAPPHPLELPGVSSPVLLHFSRTVLPDGSRHIQIVAAPDSELEPWLDAASWGDGSRIEVERHGALVSLVGEGVLAEGDILRRAEAALYKEKIPVWGIHTGTLSVSVLVPEAQGEPASRALHRHLVET